MSDDDKALNARVEALLNNPRGCFGPNGEELPCDTRISAGWTRLGLVINNFAMGSAYLIIRTAAASYRPTSQHLGKWAWNYREGQVWQADIERAVYEFQEPPRDFVNDLDLCRRELWPKIVSLLSADTTTRLELSLRQVINTKMFDGWYVEGLWRHSPYGDDTTRSFEMQPAEATPERAIVAAFLAVCERE